MSALKGAPMDKRIRPSAARSGDELNIFRPDKKINLGGLLPKRTKSLAAARLFLSGS
jgi:hypothetical protein